MNNTPMGACRLCVIAALVLGVVPHTAAAQAGSESAIQAHPALGFAPSSKCPELHPADDGPAVLVVFHVSSYGKPSQIAIKASSQDQALDAAGVRCVERLRFNPLTRLGDGAPIESWQQIAWRWARPNAPPAQPAASAASATTAAVAAASGAAGAAHAAAAPQSVELRACADATGRLARDPAILHSSGDPQLDAAAQKIAAAGAANYRPAVSANGKPVSGCVRLAVTFEAP
jgi:TonB family protein